MRVLVIGDFHRKNKEGLALMLGTEVTFVPTRPVNFDDYDVIISPLAPIDVENYPGKLFLFGPHFGVYPNVFTMINKIDNRHKNAVYIQPSKWVRDLFQPGVTLPVRDMPFAVDTARFQARPTEGILEKNVLLYSKTVDPKRIEKMKEFLMDKGYVVWQISYDKKYEESYYMRLLKRVEFCAWVGRHESQGFALQEALAMNVPLFVWDVKSLADQYQGGRPDVFGTTLSYWDATRCGESFLEESDMESTFARFLERLPTYKPREFILETVGPEAAGARLKEIINEFLPLSN